MSTVPGTSREERQAAQLAANRVAAEAAERAASQGGGAFGRGGYGDPRNTGGPTWSDSPAGIELRKQYEKSGVVFDSRGNVLYNPADIGAAEVEQARAAQGLSPSLQTRGKISDQYAASVYSESKRTVQAIRSTGQDLDRQRAETTRTISEIKKTIQEAEIEKHKALTNPDTRTGGLMADNQSAIIRASKMELRQYETRLQSLDTARKQIATVERESKRATSKAAIGIAMSKAGTGKIQTSTAAVAGPQSILESQASNRKQAQTGVKDRLYGNPNYITIEEQKEIDRRNQMGQIISNASVAEQGARPQRTRVKAQQGVTDKLYANPAFMTEDQKLNAGFSQLAEAAGGKQFAVSLSEGKPSQPRQLTQDEVNALSPNEYARYRAEYDAYNKYVSDYNANIASLNLKAKEETRQQKQANLSQWKESKSQLLSSIQEAKKLGFTTFSIRDEKGVRDVPIDRAFKEIISSKGLKGAAPIPTIPEGYTVAGSLSSQVLLESPSKQLLAIEERKKIKDQIERDPTGLSSYIYREESLSDPIVGPYGPRSPSRQSRAAGSAYYSTLASGLADIQNIGRAGAIFLTEKIGGVKASIATQLGTPQLYQQKTTGFDIAFSAPLTAAQEAFNQNNATAFLPTLKEAVVIGAKTVKGTPIPKVIGQAGGFFALLAPPIPIKFISKIFPLKYTPVVIPTGKGAERVATVFTLGYNPKTSWYVGGVFDTEQKLKPFIGEPDWSKMGLERFTPPTGSSFDVIEFAAYNKQQSKPIYDLFRYGEKTGSVKPGTVEQQVLENIERQKQTKMKVKYTTTLPVQIEGIPLRPSEMQSMQQAVSVIQKKKLTEPGKGSLIQNMMADWPKRAQGDLLDLEIKIPKNTEKMINDAEKLRERAATAAKKGDYTKQQKLLAKAEKKEAKVYAKGEEAVEYILANVKMETGRALGRKGFNIVVGDADYSKPSFADLELPKDKFYKSDVIIAHGTTRKSAAGIMEEGADPYQRPYGEPAFFGTTSKDILKTFASERVVLGKVPKADILYYKDIPKRERTMIRRVAKKEAALTGKPQWMTYQEAVSSYAKERGYKGATKPYHTTNPASPKFEYIIFEKDVFTPTKIVKPLGYKLKKGTEKDVLNMIGPREMLKDEVGEMLGNIDRPFGEKWPKGTTKFRVKDESGKVVTYKIGYQSVAKFKAISGIQSAESMVDDFSHTQEWKDRLFEGARLVKSPKTYRYEKDPIDSYMLTYRNIKYQYERGNIAGARESVQAALGMRKYYTGYDFIKGAKIFKNISDIQVSQIPKSSATLSGLASSGRAGVRSTPSLRSALQPSQDEQRGSPLSARPQSASSRIISTSSVPSARSTLTRSPKMQSASARSISASSPSARSISGRSTSASPRSIYDRSPRPSSTSPRPSPRPSPRTQSPLSPRPSTGSPTFPASPRPISPLSPKSVMEPIKPLKLLDLKKLQRRKALPVFVKQKTKTKKDKTKSGADFIGQAYVSQITGFAKRSDITYGRKRTLRLEEGDVRFTGKRYGRFAGSKSASLLVKSRPTLMKPFRKERVIKL